MIFMYREGEAKLFKSLDDVPANEGWQDTPVTPMDQMERYYDPAAQAFSYRSPAMAAEPKPDRMAADLERAAELNIKVDGRWSHQRLLAEIDKAEAAEDSGDST